MLRLDPNLRWLYTELPMHARAAAAAADGFKGVEVAFPYEEPAPVLHARLQAEGLALVQILSPLDWDAGERGLAAVPGREEDFARGIDTAIAYALQAGRPLIHPALGNMPADAGRAQCRATALANLRAASARAATHCLTLIVEACCTARFPAFLLHSVDETVDFLDELGCDNVKLCFDTFHVQMEAAAQGAPAGGDALAGLLARAWPHVGHIQLGNTPGRNEPGEGELDLAAFVEEVARRGWSGWVGLEYTPRDGTARSLGWARDMGLLPKEGA